MIPAVAEIIATSFYAGYVPKAPGTAGAAVGVLLVWLLHHFAGWTSSYMAGFVLLTLWPSIWATNRMIDAKQSKDPQCVVVDEVLGQMLSFVGADLDRPLGYLVAFALFRAFDIWKPFPVRWFESFPGGYGVIFDDLMAGIYAMAIMGLLRHFFQLPL